MMEDAKVLAMDEPTSSLTPAEFERLAVLISELAAKGVSIIYVSHKMDEVFRVCETATILRDGRKVTDVVMKDTSESAVIARMVGRELAAAESQGLRAEPTSSLRFPAFREEPPSATPISNSIVAKFWASPDLVGAGTN